MSATPIYDQILRQVAGFPVDWLHDVSKGDTVLWMGVTVTITRMAGNRSWVDLHCEQDGHTWTKRLTLPVEEPAAAEPEPEPEPATATAEAE